MLLAAKVWTYWISWALLAATVLIVLAVLLGYAVRVTARRPPRQ